jgi:hypothetical protein
MELAQTRYLAFDRELLLSAYLAVQHFRFLLEGRQFTISLPRPSQDVSRMSARQQRQLSYLAEFGARIQHKAGSNPFQAAGGGRRN